jgi:bifunctional enzyme CysN/CysC
MVTGASTAEAAIVLVDARNGIVEQSRRHAYLSSLLGIRHLIACVNKMDLVDWSVERFREIEGEFAALAERLGVADARVIPISALHGDNVVDASARTPWYSDPPLLTQLETLEIASDRNFDDVRLPVQWIVRHPGGGRAYAGQMAGGVLQPGDEVLVLPSGERTTVSRIDAPTGVVDAAFPPMSVAVMLTDDLDVGRGDLICTAADAPPVARHLEAMVSWMADAPLRPGTRWRLKHTTRNVRAFVERIESRVDMTSLAETADSAELALNDIGRVRLRVADPLLADPYARNRATGAFVLIDEVSRDTVGAGMIVAASEEPGAPFGPHSPDVVWHEPALPRRQRWSALGLRGATVWLTGLPSSGKSRVGEELERRLVAAGRPAYLLDGENVRYGLSSDLGFSPADRHEHARRVASAARMLSDAGMVAIVALVSPAAADRAAARELHEQADLDFLEVWVDTPLEECERRDPRGLYARARAGDLPGFTGVDAPYEAPVDPQLVVHPFADGVDDAVARLLALLD